MLQHKYIQTAIMSVIHIVVSILVLLHCDWSEFLFLFFSLSDQISLTISYFMLKYSMLVKQCKDHLLLFDYSKNLIWELTSSGIAFEIKLQSILYHENLVQYA